MTTPATPESGTFWASAGAGLFAGLLIVLLVFRLTSAGDAQVARPDDDPAITVLNGSSDADTAVAAESPTTTSAPVQADGSGVASGDAGSNTAGDLGLPTTVPTEPKVEIQRSIGPCKYGDDCLVASFSISGFDEAPPQFVCEFQDGTRYTFSFEGDSVLNACSTGTVPGSITIEVLGVRSETITNP